MDNVYIHYNLSYSHTDVSERPLFQRLKESISQRHNLNKNAIICQIYNVSNGYCYVSIQQKC